MPAYPYYGLQIYKRNHKETANIETETKQLNIINSARRKEPHLNTFSTFLLF